MLKNSHHKWYLLFGGVAAFLSAVVWVAYRTWPRTINLSLAPSLPVVEVDGNHWLVKVRSDALIAEVADFRSEVQAYLYFEYLRSHIGMSKSSVLMTAKPDGTGPNYRIYLVVDKNLLASVPQLARLRAQGFIHHFTLSPCPEQDLAYKRVQTNVFVNAYNPLTAPKLESLSSARMLLPVARFLVFKSLTDKRIRENIDPVPQALSFDQAKTLAADVLEVAQFYQLPLDVFLGIGAMENNYMNVRGDREHAVWKRRPQKGDIILQRRRGRTLVSDYAMGVWQITRETLRYAHLLYLQDHRDYSALPPQLRPLKKLNFDLANSEVLTTYAGLLLRHLLDKTGGDVPKAVGAYNGSLRNPNYQYAAGVNAVAAYARSFLERAANLNGMNVAETWMEAEPPFKPGEETATNTSALPPQNSSSSSD